MPTTRAVIAARMARKPLAFALALACLAVSRFSGAADWWMIPPNGKSDGEQIAYVDKSSLQRQKGGNGASASIWLQFREDRTSAEGSYRALKQRLRVDCAQKTAGIDAETRISSYGETIARIDRPDPALTPVAPDSGLGAILEFVCTGGKRPFKTLPVYDPGKDAEQRFWLLERNKK